MPTDQDGNELEELPKLSINLTTDSADGDEVRYEARIDTRDEDEDAATEMAVNISSEIQELLEGHDDLVSVGVARDEKLRGSS